MADTKENMTAKAVGLGVALIAAWVAQQLITGVWKITLGHKPPKAQDEGDARFGEVAIAAVVTGALVGLSRVLATRGTARFLH